MHPHGKLLNILQHVQWHMETKMHAMFWNLKQWSIGLGRASIQVFYDTFLKPMVTIVLCGKMLYDQEIIYKRMIVLMSSKRSVPIDTCMITDIVFQ